MNALPNHIKDEAQCECSHCGTPFRPKASDDEFCCSGCEYVYRLIRDENLERFYELRGKRSQPVGFRVFANKGFDWLEDLQALSESEVQDAARLTLSLQGISCVGCVWLIEKLFSDLDGGVDCRIDAQRGQVEIAWISGKFDLRGFAGRLHDFGYELAPQQNSQPSEGRKIVWRLGLCGAFALNAMLFTLPTYLGMNGGFVFAGHFGWLSAAFASLSMIFGGSFFIGKASRAILRGVVHMDLPISIGLVAAYCFSWYGFVSEAKELLYFDFVSTFVFLMLCGKWMQVFAIERNRSRLADFEIEAPTILMNGASGDLEKSDSADLKPGERYWLESGCWIPVESELHSERACLGLDWINGESESRLFAKGGVVPSGGMNQNSELLELVANETWEDSLLNKLLSSHDSRSGNDSLTQRWITVYLVAVMLIASLGGFWWVSVGLLEKALVVFISTLVVSCPCAIGVALPLVDELAVAKLKLSGVFVRTNSLWNRLIRVRQVVFDKTGTLTKSTLEWTNPNLLKTLDDEALSALSAMVLNSRHPVAMTVREHLLAKGLYRNSGKWNVFEELGFGLWSRGDGVDWKFGRSNWASGDSRSITVLVKGDSIVAEFEFEDCPWVDTEVELARLRERGISVAILSGDRAEKVENAALELGVDCERALGEQTPEMKRQWLLDNQGDETLMIGDGANDSLAFDTALCSGTPVVEKNTLAGKADFYYLGTGIQGIGSLFEITKYRTRTIKSVLTFAIGYNLITVSLALIAIVTPLLAAILMPLSSIVSLALAWAFLRSAK